MKLCIAVHGVCIHCMFTITSMNGSPGLNRSGSLQPEMIVMVKRKIGKTALARYNGKCLHRLVGRGLHG